MAAARAFPLVAIAAVLALTLLAVQPAQACKGLSCEDCVRRAECWWSRQNGCSESEGADGTKSCDSDVKEKKRGEALEKADPSEQRINVSPLPSVTIQDAEQRQEADLDARRPDTLEQEADLDARRVGTLGQEHFQALPLELMVKILEYLPHPSDLLRLGLTCKMLRKAVKSVVKSGYYKWHLLGTFDVGAEMNSYTRYSSRKKLQPLMESSGAIVRITLPEAPRTLLMMDVTFSVDVMDLSSSLAVQPPADLEKLFVQSKAQLMEKLHLPACASNLALDIKERGTGQSVLCFNPNPAEMSVQLCNQWSETALPLKEASIWDDAEPLEYDQPMSEAALVKLEETARCTPLHIAADRYIIVRQGEQIVAIIVFDPPKRLVHFLFSFPYLQHVGQAVCRADKKKRFKL